MPVERTYRVERSRAWRTVYQVHGTPSITRIPESTHPVYIYTIYIYTYICTRDTEEKEDVDARARVDISVYILLCTYCEKRSLPSCTTHTYACQTHSHAHAHTLT